MDSWFIRHWSSGTHPAWSNTMNDDIQRRLCADHEIAVHYGTIRSADPGRYAGSARHAMRRFNELAKEGGYVCAHYPATGNMLVGKVQPGSVIACDRKDIALKRLKLTRCRRVRGGEREFLLAAKLRQGTLCRWRKIGGLLASVVERRAIPKSLELLTPAMQETVCQEYLRRKCGMSFLLLPFGRTTETIDALGTEKDGRRLVVNQVTCATDPDALRKKADALVRFPADDSARRVFFCPRSAAAESVEAACQSRGLEFVWFETVTRWLEREEPGYARALFSWLTRD